MSDNWLNFVCLCVVLRGINNGLWNGWIGLFNNIGIIGYYDELIEYVKYGWNKYVIIFVLIVFFDYY